MPLLEPSNFISQIFWLLVFFIIQYLLMAKFIIPAFSRTINGRRNFIHNKIIQADKMATKAEKLKKDYEEKLNKAKLDNINQMNELIEKIKKESDQQMQILDHELAEDYLKNEKRIKDFIEYSSNDIDKLAIETAYNLVSKIAEKKVNKSDLNKYLN